MTGSLISAAGSVASYGLPVALTFVGVKGVRKWHDQAVDEQSEIIRDNRRRGVRPSKEDLEFVKSKEKNRTLTVGIYIALAITAR
jgi:hypothetical protein